MIGGAGSGKSRYAQGRAEAAGLTPAFIAPAQAFDDAMRAPPDLTQAMEAHGAPDRVLLIDCLALRASSLLLNGRDIPSVTGALVEALENARSSLLPARRIGNRAR